MDTNTTNARKEVHSSSKHNYKRNVATLSAKSRESSGETDKAKASTEASVGDDGFQLYRDPKKRAPKKNNEVKFHCNAFSVRLLALLIPLSVSFFQNVVMKTVIRFIIQSRSKRDKQFGEDVNPEVLRFKFDKRTKRVTMYLTIHGKQHLTQRDIEHLRAIGGDIDLHLAGWVKPQRSKVSKKPIDEFRGISDNSSDWGGNPAGEEWDVDAYSKIALTETDYETVTGEQECTLQVQTDVKAYWFLPISLIMLALAIVFASIYNQG